jgi:hypothetical protein
MRETDMTTYSSSCDNCLRSVERAGLCDTCKATREREREAKRKILRGK